ncbi:unnamed protein product [Blepharisma stoltei]|uniref:GPI mannosyltransferase 2 n=1 Tax=Blepharisma stoltei TaxID=1481888 RepID=A0AAU9J2Y1_9CILI|nr:unnamed protein product [Blepharisma stoltei]
MNILKTALGMKVFILVLSNAMNYLIEDYDNSITLRGSHIPNSPIGKLFAGLARWDSLFFLQISHEGYLYEKNHAFFPLYPLLIRYLAKILSPILFWLSVDDLHLISGILISWANFIFATYFLIKLGKKIMGDKKYSQWCGLLFIINPATIFMTAICTTSLFSFLSMAGIYFLYRNVNWSHDKAAFIMPSFIDKAISCGFFTLATAARSNGSFLFVFLLCFAANSLFSNYMKKTLNFKIIFKEIFTLGLFGIIQISPIIIFTFYGASIYCTGQIQSPYCSKLFPNIYSYVQETYWNVGSFRYWEAKQIPNFLLASPMLYISICACFFYIKHDYKRFFSFSSTKSSKDSHEFLNNPLLVPFIWYWLLNIFIITFIANIQIATRILASNPAVYWYIGQDTMGKHKWVIYFFIIYMLVGTSFYSNFYPWT